MKGAKSTEDIRETSPNKLEANSVAIGLVVGFEADSRPMVSFLGCPNEDGLPARTTMPLAGPDIGSKVALLFEDGNADKPVILGKIWSPAMPAKRSQSSHEFSVDLDGERVSLSAKKEIVLKCGKASITLTRAGKIIIRGAYVSSGSSGVNKLKGASVHIN